MEEYYIRTKLDEEDFIASKFEISKITFEENIDSFIEKIEKGLNGNLDGTWMLCAKENDKEDYIVCQVASSQDISDEIRKDLNSMLPRTDKDIKWWSSCFYKNIFKMDYSQTLRCQKYNHIYNNYNNFAVVIMNYENVFSSFINDYKLSSKDYENLKKECAEVYLAYKYKAVYWNPNHFNGECKILKKIKKWNKD